MNAADDILGSPADGQRGESPALLWRGGTLSYFELGDMVNRVGNGLRNHNVEPENRVLMLLKDTPEFVFAFLGVMKIGAVAVPLNVRCSEADLLFALNDSRAKVLIVDQDYLARYHAVEARLEHDVRVVVAGPEYGRYANLRTFAMSQSPVLLAEPMSCDDMAYWIYTAGATGEPKAAVHVQHDVQSSDVFLRDVLGLTAADRLFSTSRLFNPYAMGTCLFGGLRIGASVILDGEWPSTKSTLDIVDRLRPTAFFSVPTMYRRLLHEGFADRAAFTDVQCFVSGGEFLPDAIRADWSTATGRSIVESYGTAESSFTIFADGRPFGTTIVELRDEFGAVILDHDRDGELWVKMESMSDRYWNRQERSQAASRGASWRTGDMFRVTLDGCYRYRGRSDDMLRISGQWVTPREIEEEVLQLDAIDDCAVVAAPDADELPRLILYVVTAKERTAQPALRRLLLERLTKRLAVYKCPREIRFVDAIPRAATGNIQRFRLRDALESLS
jgi:benzoate-CoA ligase